MSLIQSFVHFYLLLQINDESLITLMGKVNGKINENTTSGLKDRVNNNREG